MNPESWNNNTKVFFIENGEVYTYHSLFCSLQTLSKSFTYSSLSKYIYLPVNKNYQSYCEFIFLMMMGVTIYPCADNSFNEELVIKNTGIKFLNFNQLPKKHLKESYIKLKNKFENSHFVVKTSGSSGEDKKYILHATKNFIKKYQKIGSHFNKTYLFSPFDSIAGIETLLEVLFHQKTVVSSGDDLSPEIVLQNLSQYEVDYFQTTPTYMGLLMISGQLKNYSLEKLVKIAYGSEPSVDKVIKYFREKFPNIQLMHTYGMTEIGILKTLRYMEDDSYFILDNNYNQFRIINETLEVTSMTKMIKYLNLNLDNQMVCDEKWFKTNDRVVCKNEAIKVIGRLGDMINIAGRKFFPIELEEKILKLNMVEDVLISTEENGIIGTAIIAHVLLIKDYSEEKFKIELKKYLETDVPNYMHPHKIRFDMANRTSNRFKKMRKL